MPLNLACPGCREEVAVSRIHRGKEVLCPACGERHDVPATVDFGPSYEHGLADRRAGYSLLHWSLFALFLLLPPLNAGLWFYAQMRIDRARREERPVPEPLRAARVVSMVGTVSYTLFWARMFLT